MKLPYKIFQIGFNRCGTRSICDYFEYSCKQSPLCCHWDLGKLGKSIKNNLDQKNKLLDGQYERYDVFTDMTYDEVKTKPYYSFEGLNYFKLLDRDYPNSKFILNTRRLDGWLKSRYKHYFSKCSGWRVSMKDLFGHDDPRDFWENQWKVHHQEVQSYFKDRPSDLLIFNIETEVADDIVSFFKELNFATNKFERKTD